MNGDGPLVFLVAGEPSGDVLGGKLMAALKRATGGKVRFTGVGGERMAAEGLASLFPLDDIAVMGLTEVLPRLPRILRRIRRTARAVRRQRPDAVVTIDAPSFGLRVADKVRDTGVPLIQYVAPQLWAWRPGRAKRLAGRIDRLMALLPFEPAFFRRLGVDCTYVGHPVIDDAGGADGAAFRRHHDIATDAPLLAVMPGSRIGLVRRMLPVFAAGVDLAGKRYPGLRIVMPVVAGTEALVRAATAGWPNRPVLVRDATEKRAAFAAANAALAVSGTATMELAVAGLPTVVAYKVGRISEFLARRMIKVQYVAMPNLILDRPIVPELLQADCKADRIAAEISRLLDDPAAAAAQREGFAEIRAQLGQDGPSPSDRAARVILETIEATKKQER
ncbi:MAG: lipid-A-disaccharide synthase [Rhodospirillales bacterium]|nr:lipid-A-disaccharide synthase [Rhodospirillales bacterium]